MIHHTQKQFALVGAPLGHSVSPLIHRELGKIKGIDITYQLLETTAETLPERFAEELTQLDGFNVTLPLKTAVLPLLDSLSPRAALYGAVNTVGFSFGQAIGMNTDGEGFLRSIQSAPMAIDGRVLIAGAGGAARMFACECLAAGGEVTLAVRRESREKAVSLQQELAEKTEKTVTVLLLDDTEGKYDLLINATPVGMVPQTDACPFEKNVIMQAGGVFDAVYYPLETKLLQTAKAADVPCLNGLPMLVWQAAAAEELWNGVVFSEEEVNRVTAIAQKELSNR